MSAAIAPQPLPQAPPSHHGGPIIIKFGGTSLANPARIRRAATRVRRLWRAGHPMVVVVSAAGHTTDRILRRAHATFRAEPGAAPVVARELDRALATGEDLSAALLAGTLLAHGVPALSMRGGEAGIVATGDHGGGRPVTLRAAPLQSLLDAGQVPVVSGFQAFRADGETLTLGRGGSDLTAVFLAVALGASECQIVTDVDGVYSADPNVDLAATRYDELTHHELVRITASGAVVVHADAAARAAADGLPLRIFHHGAPLRRVGGTRVQSAPEAVQ